MIILFCSHCCDMKKVNVEPETQYCKCRKTWAMFYGKPRVLSVSEDAVILEAELEDVLKSIRDRTSGNEITTNSYPAVLLSFRHESTFDRDIDDSEDED